MEVVAVVVVIAGSTGVAGDDGFDGDAGCCCSEAVKACVVAAEADFEVEAEVVDDACTSTTVLNILPIPLDSSHRNTVRSIGFPFQFVPLTCADKSTLIAATILGGSPSAVRKQTRATLEDDSG
jgi:hypothetical protein